MDSLTGLGTAVALSKIESSLRQLWDADEAASKASLMNFAVYAERSGALLENQAIVQQLTREHACRVLLIELNREAEVSRTRAWISAHCHLLGGQKSVCSEQVAFLLEGREPGRLRNLVFSHCESDLPLVLWWQGDISDRFSERLYSHLDRLIVDSSNWSDPALGLETVQQAESWTHGGMVMQDLEWTRSFHHRMAMAALLDEPAARDLLSSLDEVSITCRSAHRVSAVMCFAWMLEQAGWSLAPGLNIGESTDPACGYCWTVVNAQGREFTVRLSFDESGPALGQLMLKSGACEACVCPSQDQLHLLVSLTGQCSRIEALHPAAPESASDLVGEQLSRGGRNALFRKVLPRVIELLQGMSPPSA